MPQEEASKFTLAELEVAARTFRDFSTDLLETVNLFREKNTEIYIFRKRSLDHALERIDAFAKALKDSRNNLLKGTPTTGDSHKRRLTADERKPKGAKKKSRR